MPLSSSVYGGEQSTRGCCGGGGRGGRNVAGGRGRAVAVAEMAAEASGLATEGSGFGRSETAIVGTDAVGSAEGAAAVEGSTGVLLVGTGLPVLAPAVVAVVAAAVERPRVVTMIA